MQRPSKNAFEIKYDIIGEAKNLSKSATLLNRIIEWKQEGISWEPDPRHTELVIKHLGLEGGKVAVTPGVREHDRRRPKAGGAGGAEELPMDMVIVATQDRLGDAVVRVGDKVHVKGHGAGTVTSIKHIDHGQSPGTRKTPEVNRKVEVKYEDGTKYWCDPRQLKADVERKYCDECGCVHGYGELPMEGVGEVFLAKRRRRRGDGDSSGPGGGHRARQSRCRIDAIEK